jgi:CrcB protein
MISQHITYALIIAIGGAFGACFRASIYVLCTRIFSKGKWANFPMGTFFSNVLGSLLLGFLSGLMLNEYVSVDDRDLVGTGFCGSLTTFSAFSNDSYKLIQKKKWKQVGIHYFLNIIIGFSAAACGYFIGKQL